MLVNPGIEVVYTKLCDQCYHYSLGASVLSLDFLNYNISNYKSYKRTSPLPILQPLQLPKYPDHGGPSIVISKFKIALAMQSKMTPVKRK